MDWKKLGKALLFPPIWAVSMLTVLSAVMLIIVFGKGWEKLPVAYPVYVMSFYALVVLCSVCWKVLPGYYRSMRGRVYGNEYANRYFTDAVYKTEVNLHGALGVNMIYVIVNAISAVVYQTHWFAIFAVYYVIMAMMRFLLVRYVSNNPIGASRMGELKRARLCAYILLTVNLALSGAVLMMVYFNRGFQYQGFLIYVMAMYAFYTTTTAIIDMVRYRKYNSPVLSIVKVIKLAAALFSMLFLETAMFAQFGRDTSPVVKKTMIMVTGGVVSVIVVAVAVYMIVRTTKEIRKFKQEREQI